MQFIINKDWSNFLKEELQSSNFYNIQQELDRRKASGENIYPSEDMIFNAFNLCPLKKLKIVLIGQDPYHQKGQAMGLSFSVPNGQKLPPSLRNIFKEIHSDINILVSENGDLSPWANQGILLLNSILTVRANEAASHAKIGWEEFTDRVIKKISDNFSSIIFLLWGNYAKSKKTLINTDKHFILETAHPSPLARGAFFGCKHFSKSNAILRKLGKDEIDWQC